MILTYKTRIAPTSEQVSVLWELSEQCRRLYNLALHERITQWQEEQSKPPTARKYLNYLEQQNTLPQLKERVPEFRWVYSKVLQMVLRTLDADYKSFLVYRGTEIRTRTPLGLKASCSLPPSNIIKVASRCARAS